METDRGKVTTGERSGGGGEGGGGVNPIDDLTRWGSEDDPRAE